MKNKKKDTHRPLARMNVSVLLLTDRNAAVAHAALERFDTETGEVTTDEATGSAKREQGDSCDDKIAASLAVGRALVNLGRTLQQTGRSQVEHAMEERAAAGQAKMMRLLRGMKPAQEKLLPVSEIRERFGADAAERAAARRQPHGRHARDGQKG